MLHISDKRRIENELAPAIGEEVLAMLLDTDSASEEYYNILCTLTMALAHDVISDSRYLDQGTQGSAGRLPIGDAIAEYLTYPDRSFVVNFRMHRASLCVLIDLLHESG